MKPIFLIGYMGSGKTTLGRVLCEEMKLSFIDIDINIETRYHSTVSQLFAERGEADFRIIERNMLYEVAEIQNVVIACGGGTPCHFSNMEYMNQRGITIYLSVSVECLLQRLSVPTSKARRPLIASKSKDELAQFIKLALQQRTPIYNQSQIVFDASSINDEIETLSSAKSLAEIIKSHT